MRRDAVGSLNVLRILELKTMVRESMEPGCQFLETEESLRSAVGFDLLCCKDGSREEEAWGLLGALCYVRWSGQASLISRLSPDVMEPRAEGTEW